ncbi:hypothetical protein [Corynebacterium sp. UBA2622]|uniref:hypothetical protein n=1 Tax=Corynebacterium sp. UBA2622 TaxID=1946393 RepID=UPI0025C38498|nr:hypothetical protein [Corynebacterium sp. UBA2622]
MTALWFIAAVALTALVVWSVVTAQRLDRLHIRVDRSRDALQAALDRRCAVLAAYHPELTDAARAAEEVPLLPGDLDARIAAEARLGEEAAPLLAGAAAEPRRVHDTTDADTRVMLALRFYNDAVADTRALRLNPVVRALRLGGTAPLPQFCSLSL